MNVLDLPWEDYIEPRPNVLQVALQVQRDLMLSTNQAWGCAEHPLGGILVRRINHINNFVAIWNSENPKPCIISEEHGFVYVRSYSDENIEKYLKG